MRMSSFVLLGFLLFPLTGFSAPFLQCPSQAFLVQDSVAKIYGVNLATGFVEELSTDMGTNSKLNAMAFNLHDDYLYAWSYEYGTLVKIGDDFQVSPLAIDWRGLDPQTSFYVGDIAVDENAHYLYRSGAAFGLYRIELDPNSPDFLAAAKVIDGSALNLRIFDLAFHPSDGHFYSVDGYGQLWRVNSLSGASDLVSDIGVSGTFGAVYFDLEGMLYISRNSDGKIFQIDVSQSEPIAIEFAQGPSSGNNDGARCAIAPILSQEANIDFGDAPDSYASSLGVNGARHQLVAEAIRLGSLVDGENDARVFPLSDDSDQWRDDEDGVAWVTPAQQGLEFLVQVIASKAGYLNAWIDFNSNGLFDVNEQVFEGFALTKGSQTLLIEVPIDAVKGDTWARFRVSSIEQLQAGGGAPDGEVEDLQLYIADQGNSVSFYPNASGFATVAFEDNWPAQGDYDLNDLVLKLQTRIISDQNAQLVSLELHGSVRALGASYHNGLAIRVPGIMRQQVLENNINFEINGQLVMATPLDVDDSELTVVIADDVRDYLNVDNTCDFYRTQSGCTASGELRFKVVLPFASGLALSALPPAPFDPFIFASEDYPRWPIFETSPGKTLEIHLKNQMPRDIVDDSFWSSFDDFSQPSQGAYYQNERGLPWAILIPYDWQHPWERIRISDAYPLFIPYVLSEGREYSDWYLIDNAKAEFLFSD
ncbi:LruC domain-containing protein [Alginatibacterium sediminis]|uniref:LruC domain-containing protein n=1 Tax=Alginatibacterium sediminis TaxID=2164068 RepID=A0A420EDN0_9ALTE|nr:LruC domain-containing protein [Alginatibacterium sediminis]RKF18781.1 LruC domain-containing protein [Alginatibacterium sediminis]